MSNEPRERTTDDGSRATSVDESADGSLDGSADATADGSLAGTVDTSIPISGEEFVETFPGYRDEGTALVELPGREAMTVPNDEVLRPALAASLENDLYAHQAESLEALDRDENVCVATSTSSGKTRIYALQIARNVLDARQRGEESTAYVCYPTKALSRDQERELNDFFDEIGVDVTVGVYDGDTDRGETRRRIREDADVIITNFAGVNTYLHDHDRWARFFGACDLVVIDESHTYTGVHGMHVAWILRRLERMLAYYQTDPQFVLTSATVGNPGEHSEMLIDEPVTVVDDDGSPRGPRDLVLWNPPPEARDGDREVALDDHEGTIREGGDGDTNDGDEAGSGPLGRVPATVEAPRVLSHLTYHGAQTLAFTPSRKLAELSVKRARKHRTDHRAYYADRGRGDEIEPYHAGHSRQKRHGTEHRLKNGLVDGVASTNALELGINVGSMDATIQLGYPGQRQSFWQQIGRAGRGRNRALSVMVAGNQTLDQYVVSNPGYLLESDVENAVVDVENDAVFARHLLCAADELALDESDAGTFADRERLEGAVEMWRRAGRLTGYLETGVSYAGRPRPQQSVSLYATASEEYVVRLADGIDDRHDPEMEPLARERAFRDFHEGAVRLHEGQQYEVQELIHDGPQPAVILAPTDVDYYTRTRTEVTILDAVSETSREVNGFEVHYGRARVLVYHGAYDRLSIHGGTASERGIPTDLPPLEMETQCCWIEVPQEVEQALVERYREYSVPDLDGALGDSAHVGYAGGLHAAEHATIGVAPLELMVDKRDLGGLATLTIDSHLADAGVRGTAGGRGDDGREDEGLDADQTGGGRASGGQAVGGRADRTNRQAPGSFAAAKARVEQLANEMDRRPASGWFVYDGVEGGLGFSRAIYDDLESIVRRAREHVADCDCGRVDGCPACVMDDQCGNDNRPLHREAAVDVLDHLLGEADGDGLEAASTDDEHGGERRPPLFYS